MKRWTQEEDAALRKAASERLSREDIAALIGVSLSAVRGRLSALGIKLKKGPQRRRDWEKARELAAAGCWMSEGARRLGMHHTTALYIARQMGFKWANPPEDCERGFFQRTADYRARTPYRNVVPTAPRKASSERDDVVERMMRLAGRCA